MEWATLNTLSLGNSLSVNFATDWSKDGRLFILNDACVYILKLTPKMTNINNILSFTRSEIKLCNYFAADHTGINYDDILINLPQQDLYHHVLNYNLTPKSTLSNPPIVVPTAASWSPILGDEIYESEALLAVLSNTGNLEIFVQNLFKWSVVANITELWVEQLKEEWKSVPVPKSDEKRAEIHLNRVNSSLVTSFAWGHLFDENGQKFMYLLAGHLDGCISLWKLNYFNSYNETIDVNFVHSFKTGLENITSLVTHSIDDKIVWVTIGNSSGTVKNIVTNFDKFDEINSTVIWNYKDVKVSKIISFGFDNKVGIIAIKGPYIIFAVLDKDGALISTNHTDLGNLNITGIQPFSSNNYVASTTTGVLKSLKIITTSKGYELEVNPITTDLKWDYHACYGLIRSPSKIIWGILMQPCKVIDHLTLRSPIQIVFCVAKDFDPGFYLKNSATMRLLHSWECLEILRSQSSKKHTLPCSWLTKIEKFDDLSLYEIRLYYWISLSCEMFIKKRSNCRKLKTVLPSRYDLKDILFLRFRLERINLIFDKLEKGEKLRPFDYQSLYLLHDAIISFKNDGTYPRYFGSETDEEIERIIKKYDEIPMEDIPKCLWCEENLSSSSCSTKHPDQRCCISGVQISGLAKWECGKCGLPAHHLIEDSEILCPFCDVLMVRMTE